MSLSLCYFALRVYGLRSVHARTHASRLPIPILPRFGVGVLGGFTTFSAFSLETALMIERGQLGGAAAYAGLSVVLSIAALFGGLFTMRALA